MDFLECKAAVCHKGTQAKFPFPAVKPGANASSPGLEGVAYCVECVCICQGSVG